jgi:uncharacterized membrane protein YbhN (UPF0104 family)
LSLREAGDHALSVIDQTRDTFREGSVRRRRRLISGLVYLGLAIVAITVVVPQFLGQDKDLVLPLLQRIRPEYLILALALQAARYTCFGLVSRQIAAMLGYPLARRDVAQMMLASYALSRIFSAGGATAFLVRVQYYLRQGLTPGRILALFITHNMGSSAALLITYLFGISVLWQMGSLDEIRMLAAIAWLGVAVSVASAQIAAGLYPTVLERAVQRALGRMQAREAQTDRWLVPGGILLTLALAIADAFWLTHTTAGNEQVAAAGMGALLILALAALVLMLFQPHVKAELGRRLAVLFARGWRSRHAQPAAVSGFTNDLAAAARRTFGNPRGLLSAYSFQALGLAADIATLIVTFQALQVPASPALIVAVFIIAYYAQLIAPTPGEAGAMEFALLGVLLSLGFSPLQATTTTLFYRFVSFWLPIPVGVLCYFNLKRQGQI